MNDATNDANDSNDAFDVTAEGAPLGPDQGTMRERRTAGRGGRRRSGAPSVATISWRDIPAQLTARAGAEQHKVLLHARFQHAIDRAAAVAGLTATNDYVQEWRTSNEPLGSGDVAAQLDQQCAELEAAYPRERLETLVANGGLEPASGDGRASTGAVEHDDSTPTIEDLEANATTPDPNDELDSP